MIHSKTMNPIDLRLHGWGISSLQDLTLESTRRHRKLNIYIKASGGIRTYDPTVREVRVRTPFTTGFLWSAIDVRGYIQKFPD